MRREEESFVASDMTWLGSLRDTKYARTATLRAVDFDKATYWPDGYIKSGTIVNTASESRIKPYDGDDNGNAQIGFVLTDQVIKSEDDVLAVPVLRSGTVIWANLPIRYGTTPPADAHFAFIKDWS